ncbi:orotate phosphoribosyltransferase [Pseudalkalibacillus berkeleyi]|uniref:Orotate phosphoribosyltransferase n=1 Tax=Pseudalkalibacillus berkeleyi TaxID=1069813 RepID=A0ABS9GW68_9BACL|nr:orotate phosphoribosyltransferase [Pseudalkalibacillus berkeleyi]MCF6137044.1 orotate phosphoribosyltransferase [Pseudalkalibacillus berkeleyi]
MKRQVAKYLLDIEAVTLNPDAPFTWSSGLRSPIYCDNRLIISHPEIRSRIADYFVQIIRSNYAEVDVIAGTATAGIPHAALVAERMNLPMVYVRSKPKSHGTGSQIEGKINKGDKVVIIEDLISTAGSALTAMKALNEAEASVLGCAAIFTYELQKGKEAIKNAQMDVQTITDFSTLIHVAVNEKKVSEESVEHLHVWCNDPESWSRAVAK